jgi:hypothetical protein
MSRQLHKRFPAQARNAVVAFSCSLGQALPHPVDRAVDRACSTTTTHFCWPLLVSLLSRLSPSSTPNSITTLNLPSARLTSPYIPPGNTFTTTAGCSGLLFRQSGNSCLVCLSHSVAKLPSAFWSLVTTALLVSLFLFVLRPTTSTHGAERHTEPHLLKPVHSASLCFINQPHLNRFPPGWLPYIQHSLSRLPLLSRPARRTPSPRPLVNSISNLRSDDYLILPSSHGVSIQIKKEPGSLGCGSSSTGAITNSRYGLDVLSGAYQWPPCPECTFA